VETDEETDMIYEKATPNALGYREAPPELVVPHRGKVHMVDVREPDEFIGELGHVEGAELVPLAGLETAAAAWNKEEELILLCRSGARSGRGAAALTRMGFTKVVNMSGGMLAVHAARLPWVR
jgi:rhodanese-related sulfurtransferase